MFQKLKDYFRHRRVIPLGKEGEFSKIKEEVIELMDAHEQGKKYFTFVECADLITSVGAFSWKQCRVPFLLVVLFAYIRKPYKWIRNPILRWKYGKRPKVFGGDTDKVLPLGFNFNAKNFDYASIEPLAFVEKDRYKEFVFDTETTEKR